MVILPLACLQAQQLVQISILPCSTSVQARSLRPSHSLACHATHNQLYLHCPPPPPPLASLAVSKTLYFFILLFFIIYIMDKITSRHLHICGVCGFILIPSHTSCSFIWPRALAPCLAFAHWVGFLHCYIYERTSSPCHTDNRH